MAATSWQDEYGPRLFRGGLAAGLIFAISLLHYVTPLHLPALHDILQRLYYIPIILAAFWFGLRGGLVASVVVSVMYAPHVIFQWGGHVSMELEKYLEIVLYNVVGGITGILSEREQRHGEELRQTAQGLEESCRRLREQAEIIVELEEQVRRSEKLSTLGELAAVLAHEIRNPLGSIRGTAEILKDDFRPGDRKHEFLEIMVKESDRLNHVIEDFLRLARPRKGEPTACDVGEELQNVVTLVTAEARRRNIRIEYRHQPLPRIRGEREKLMQAFLNIVLNGLQATPAGGALSIAAREAAHRGTEPGSIEVTFSDTGSGIDADSIGRIFEPFYSTKEEGTGLGLAVTRKIIEEHGGTITVQSVPGEGSTFLVALPLLEELEASA